MLETISRPNSVILTDWAADVDNLRVDRKSFVYHLLILSLLYDEVLIQDELIVLSKQISNWFGLKQDNWIWQELFDLDSLVVLRHPIAAYRTNKLKSLAEEHPIEARAKYIHKYGTKGDQIFHPTEIQNSFYSFTEYCLRQQDNSRKREVGKNNDKDIQKEFSINLLNVLTNQNYSSWLNSRFPKLHHDDVSRFLEYIHEPVHLEKAFKKNHIPLKKITDQDKKVILNRSLSYQISTLFPSDIRTSFQQIIQAAFYKPFCERENAVGRYGGMLKAMPPPKNYIENNSSNHESIVEIADHVNVPIGMPELKPGFASIINAIRTTDAGKDLRKSVARLGDFIAFEDQKNIWGSVAAELAEKIGVPNNYGVSIGKIVSNSLKSAAIGVTVHTAINPQADNDFLKTLIAAGLYSAGMEAISLIYEPFYNLWKVRSDKHDLCLKLENAVDFRCTWIQEPANLE